MSLDFTTIEAATANRDKLIYQLQVFGAAKVVLIKDEKELNKLEADLDSLFRDLVNDDSSGKSSGDQAGLLRGFGAGVDARLMRHRLHFACRWVFEAIHGLPIVPEEDLKDVEFESTSCSIDAVALLGKQSKHRGNPKVVLDGSVSSHQKRMGSNLPLHMDLNKKKATHGSKVAKDLAERGIGVGFPVQGFVSAFDVPTNGAGFICAFGSREYKEDYFLPDPKGDFCKLSEKGYQFFSPRMFFAKLKRGECVLWASDLVHGNKAADAGVDPTRKGFYICRIPFFGNDNERREIVQKKVTMVKSGKIQTHWPNNVDSTTGGSHYSNRGDHTRVLYGTSKGINHGSPVFEEELYKLMQRGM